MSSLAVARTTAATSTTEPGSGAVEIVPPDESFGEATLGEWSARQWQWSESVPADISPSMSDQGCGLGQFGPVFLLENTGVDRTCVVAEGTAIYVVVADVECSTVEPPPFFGDNEADLRECAAAGFDEFWPTPPSVTVDGVAVPGITRFRTQTPVFSFTLPEDNLFGAPAGTTATKAVSDGIAVMLKPLSVGQHRIVISYTSPFLPGPGSTTYNLTVVDKHAG